MTKIKNCLNLFNILLLLIVFFGGLLRVYRLSEIPVGFHIDEAQIGYNAYSLWKTGRDETGKFLSTHLTLWKVERPLGISYLTIPGIMIFGLNEFGTRFPTVIIGTLTIILVYFLTKEIFNNKKMALLTSLLLAISPWHINLSRATSEAIISLFFYVLGAYFGFKAINKNSYLFVIFTYLAFIGSFFLYHATRITIPCVLLFFIIFAFKQNKIRLVPFFIFISLMYFIFPLIPLSKTSFDRFKLVSVFNNPETKLLLEEQIREDGSSSNIYITRFFHNKIVNYSIKLLDNFSTYFNYDFLLFKGGLPTRYSIPNIGLIYFLELPLIAWGTILLTSNVFRGERFLALFILIWIFLGVFSATLTVEESPNVNRALFILPAFQWLIAIAILDLINRLKDLGKVKYLIVLFVGGIYFWNVLYFFHQYSVHTFTHRPWNRYFEMKDLVYTMNKYNNLYKRKIMTFNSTEPYIYFLFYNKVDPYIIQKLVINKGAAYLWDHIPGIELSRRDCPIVPKNKRNKDTLVVYKVQCYFPQGARVLKRIKYSDGETSLVLVDFPKGYLHQEKNLKYEEEKTSDILQ